MTTPLSAPVTYQQALAMAAESAAKKSPSSAAEHALAVTATMADSTIAARDRAAAHAKQAIGRLWAAVNPYSNREVLAFAAQAARIMMSAQSAAARAAAVAQSQQLLAVGVSVPAVQTVPVDVRAKSAAVVGGKLILQRPTIELDYDGQSATITAADMTTAAVFQRAAQTYRWVISQGGTDADQQSVLRMNVLIDDNLMLAQRLAQQQVLAATDEPVDLDRAKVKVIGYRRVIHPELSRGGTCGMCIAASDRIYKIGTLLPIHDNCKCTIAAVTEDYDPADELNAVDLNQLYKDAGGTGNALLKRTRYQVGEHGELGPVLVPKRAYKPRTTKSKVRSSRAGIGGAKETPAEIAARHLPLLRESLADLRRRGVSEDSPQIAYHEQQIAEFAKLVADK